MGSDWDSHGDMTVTGCDRDTVILGWDTEVRYNLKYER